MVIRTSPETATVDGELYFSGDRVLRVMQFVDFRGRRIRSYSYELFRGAEKVWWCDPWPHPGDASLASTHPHHRHVAPDIKHHQVPDVSLSFVRPNLPVLVNEILARD